MLLFIIKTLPMCECVFLNFYDCFSVGLVLREREFDVFCLLLKNIAFSLIEQHTPCLSKTEY